MFYKEIATMNNYEPKKASPFWDLNPVRLGRIWLLTPLQLPMNENSMIIGSLSASNTFCALQNNEFELKFSRVLPNIMTELLGPGQLSHD